MDEADLTADLGAREQIVILAEPPHPEFELAADRGAIHGPARGDALRVSR